MIKKILLFLVIICNFNVYAQLSDCDSVFWTLEINGPIRHWNLSNGTITGGAIEVTAPITGYGLGVAWGNNGGDNTFIVSATGENILKYVGNDAWETIPLTIIGNQLGGYSNHLYFRSNQTLYYYNGSSLDEIVTLPDGQNFFSDVAVDTGGRAWVFVGTGFAITHSINVYDHNGLVTSYPFEVDSYGTSGSFFLNDVLYFGGSSSARPFFRNKITPIYIIDGTPVIGTGIPFTSNGVHMASCNSNTLATAQFQTADAVLVYPNPTMGNIQVISSKKIAGLALYNLTGMLLQSVKGNAMALDAYAEGLYLLKVDTEDGVISKVIKKE